MTKTCPRCNEIQAAHQGHCVCGFAFTDSDQDHRPGESEALSAQVSPGDPDKDHGKGTIPEPLADPLRQLRTVLEWLNIFTVTVMVAVASILLIFNILAGVSVAISAFFGWLILFGLTQLLPNRQTDVLYLRSFRADADTGGIRTSLERAFGDQVRVSGILDPKRRWPKFIRFMFYTLFVMKYANPKYLNLEAGDEWRVGFGDLWVRPAGL